MLVPSSFISLTFLIFLADLLIFFIVSVSEMIRVLTKLFFFKNFEKFFSLLLSIKIKSTFEALRINLIIFIGTSSSKGIHVFFVRMILKIPEYKKKDF